MLYLAAAVVLLVVAAVVHRKWRHSVARSEEVRRLLVFASEEAARAEAEAELEAAAPAASVHVAPPRAAEEFVVFRPVVNECAFCFSPASTRCARCKAVRYCSGKCQIAHWRQGHKDECRPYAIPRQFSDVGVGSNRKLFQQEGFEFNRNSFNSEGTKIAEPFKNSERNCTPTNFCGNKDSDFGYIADRVAIDSSSDENETPDGHRSHEDHFNHTNQDVQYGSKSSSRQNDDGPKEWNADGTNKCSITDPHTPIYGFWEGAIKSSPSKVDSHDKFAGLTSCHSGYADLQNSRSSLSSSFKFDPKSDPSVGVGVSDDSTVDIGVGHFLSLQKTNPVTSDTRTLRPVLSNKDEVLSNASVVRLPSNTRRQSVHCAETRKVVHAGATTSFDFSNVSPNSKNGFKTSMLKVVDQLRVSKSSRHCQSGVGSEITGRYNDKGLFSYELFVKLYNWKKVELVQPCGLLNCGNSCYANAVLQCLAFTPPLTAYLLHGLHSKACKWRKWCFTCEFQSLLLKAKEGVSPLSPEDILSQIYKTKSHFGKGKEEDAHEFLRYVADAMQSACLKEAGVYASRSVKEDSTLVGLTFGGYLRSKIKCMKCGGKSEQHERMMDLTVEIGDVGTLEEALKRFTDTEILDSENKYHCSRCKTYERAKKKLRILEAPNVLTIALKRFQSGKFGKLNKWIRFPEIMDLAPFVSGTSDQSPVYRLYGVIVHLDTMNAAFSGHYVCYVKNAENRWFEIDDSTVRPVDFGSVVTKRAYILFYARCSPRAPRLIRGPIPSDPRISRSSTISNSHSIGSWNDATIPPDTCIDSSHPNNTSFYSVQAIFEEDQFSESASSIFSEECSCSTESSNRDYSSTDDHFDPIFGNSGNDRISSWKNSSDSDSSSSSSSASLSPIHSTGKPSVQFLDSNSTKDCRILGCSSSCKETYSYRLGWTNPFSKKKSGLWFRRSMRERTK